MDFEASYMAVRAKLRRTEKELFNAHEHIAELECCEDCDKDVCPQRGMGRRCSTGEFSYYHDNLLKGNTI